ncbi:hypothetical protein D3C83_149340 [compost metagenome]
MATPNALFIVLAVFPVVRVTRSVWPRTPLAGMLSDNGAWPNAGRAIARISDSAATTL